MWRGPNNDGVSPAGDPPILWSESTNVAWKSPVPGVGHSSPIVTGGSVVVTTCDLNTEERAVVCFDRDTGRQRWYTVVAKSAIEQMHRNNTPASSTAASNGELIFVTFIVDGEYLIAALDFDGSVRWERRLTAFVSRHGFTSTPVLFEDSVIVAGMQDSADSFVARLDCSTGETIWMEPTGTDIRSFSPPHITRRGDQLALVVSGSNCTSCFDLQSGKLLWRLAGPAQKTVSSIVEVGDRLFVAGGRDGKLLAVDWSGQEDPTVAWTSTAGVPYVSSPIFAEGDLHMFSDKGVYTRVDINSGKTIQRKRALSATSASPVFAGGRLYASDESGMTVVMNLTPSVSVIAENQLDDPVFASPAVCGDELFLRSSTSLYCIRDNQDRKADRSASVGLGGR